MIHHRLRLSLVCLAVALGGCNGEGPHVVVGETDDDPPIVVLENYSPSEVLAAHVRLGDGNEVNGFQVVKVPVGARVSLTTEADPDTTSQRVVLMDGTCALWASEPIAIGDGPDSTLITVDPDRLVRVRSVSDLDPDRPAAVTSDCQDEAEGIAFPP